MSTAKVNIVHESEAQRRHARVKLPSKLLINSDEGVQYLLNIIDISASGFAIDIGSNELTLGRLYHGELLVKINSIELRIPIEFTVTYFSDNANRAGCEFSALDQEKASLLRIIISKFLAGDLVTSSDVLTTLSRDNYVKERKSSNSTELSGFRKFKALVLTGFIGCLGLAALAFVGLNLYQHYFVVKSVTAMVDIDKEKVLSPTNGYFELLANLESPIERGVPMAVITSSVYEVMSSINKENYTQDQLNEILPPELNSVIKSPCDCRIIGSIKNDREFAKQGDLLFQIAELNARPYVTAYFNFKDADAITKNTRVHLLIPGSTERFTGRIEHVAVADGTNHVNSIVATILPDQSLDFDSIKLPVNVSVGDYLDYSNYVYQAIENRIGVSNE